MRTTRELANLLHTHQSLETRGFSRNYIYHSCAAGDFVRLRSGIYIEQQNWDAANAWEQYALENIAYGMLLPTTVFSHQSAALFHQLWLITIPQRIHVYCADASRGSARMVAKHPRNFSEADIAVTDLGLRSTSVETTVVDCTKTLPLVAGVAVADSALFQRKIDLPQLRHALNSATGRGRKKAQTVASLMSPLCESSGETGTRLLLLEMGLRIIEQYEIWVRGRLTRVDFFLPDFNLIIEFDGDMKYTRYGSTEHSVCNERNREKLLTNAG